MAGLRRKTGLRKRILPVDLGTDSRKCGDALGLQVLQNLVTLVYGTERLGAYENIVLVVGMTNLRFIGALSALAGAIGLAFAMTQPAQSDPDVITRVFFRFENLTRPGDSVLVDLDDGSPQSASSEAKLSGPGAAAVRDHDRDGCADDVEAADLDGNRSAAAADNLAANRAVLGISPFTPPLSADEVRTVDFDGNGLAGGPDRVGISRVVFSGVLPSVLDFNLICTAGTIGYAAN